MTNLIDECIQNVNPLPLIDDRWLEWIDSGSDEDHYGLASATRDPFLNTQHVLETEKRVLDNNKTQMVLDEILKLLKTIK